jgi:hypothetical protein
VAGVSGSVLHLPDANATVGGLEVAALHGISGAWVKAAAPHTEAHPAGVLASFLVAAGSAIGREPHLQVGSSRHGVNEYAALVGPSATGRKGDAADIGMRPVERADRTWAAERTHSGFGSGEAVIKLLADKPDDEEPGPNDPRLLVREGELAGPLAVASRDGSTLSTTLRNAWDGRPLENNTVARGMLRASTTHVSVIAAITAEELRRRLTATDQANGFVNRFLFLAVRRVRELPEPPPLPDELVAEFADHLAKVFEHVRAFGRVTRDAEAREAWRDAYGSELSIDRPGLVGACTSRAEAHAARLSLLYALLDGRNVIGLQHHNAALALWRYCERSVQIVWGDMLGDPTADRILAEVRMQGRLTRTQVRDLFSRHRSAADLDRALDQLVIGEYLAVERLPTGGRHITVYVPCAESAESVESTLP